MIVIKELELKQFLKLFWDRKIFIVVVVIIFAIIGWAKIEYFTTPVYQASGKMICARKGENIDAGKTITSAELTMPSSLSGTYAELIKSDLVVNKVIQNLGLNMSAKALSGNISLTALTSVYYQISASSTNPEQAAQIVNEFIKVFSEEIKNFYEIDNIYVVDEAQVPTNAINMNSSKSIKMFAGIGFVVAAACVMMMFIFNNTVTNSDQIKRYTKLPTLASIPKYSGNVDLITLKDSKSPYAESIKILRTNLQYMYDEGDLQTVAITSSLPGEGKSWLTANLAVAFANAGKRTLIIDADMRRGRQHRLFNVKKIPGLSEFLRETFGNMDIVPVKGKKVAKKGLGAINRFVKIENLPGVSEAMYEDDYVTTNVDKKIKKKSLKMETKKEEVEVEIKEDDKKSSKKMTLKEKSKGKRAVEKESDKNTKKANKKSEEKETKKKSDNKKLKAKNTEKIKEEKETKLANKKEEMVEVDIPKENEPNVYEFVRETGIENLYMIASGSERLESSELLSTDKMQEALEELKEEFDMIVIDTPPVSVVADGFIISRIVDTNIIVLKHGNTEINELNKIKNNIQEIGGKVIGTVINKIPDANKKYYNTYYNKKAK